MAVIGNANLWSIIFQMVLLVQVKGTIVKREPYSVQEMSQEISSGGDIGSYSPWTKTFSSGSGGGQFLGNSGGFGIGSGSFFSSHIGNVPNFGMHSAPSGSYASFGGFGDSIGEGHIFSSGGKSISDLQDEANNKIKTLILESKINQKLAEDKVEKMRKNFGYGTFGYQGYQYPIKSGPIDLGTHHAVDLGTTLDSNSIKDSHGKLKLPVQTVLITKTLGVPIPEPYPIKHEVAVPAPYPVPVHAHYSGESYPSSYSSDYSSIAGKSSYQSNEGSLNKVVKYHENLPKSTEKHYTSASTNYVSYVPNRSSSSSSSYGRSFTPSYYSPKQSVYEF